MASKVLVYNSATGALIAQNIDSSIITPGSIVSSLIASGAIGGVLIGNYGVASGKIASGVISELELISGISIDIAETIQDPSFRAAMLISSYQPIAFNPGISGAYGLARAHSGVRPAVALAGGANVASGVFTTVLTYGRVVNPAWNFSGYIGRPVYLGTSSEVITSAPAGSGEYVQRLGTAISQVSVFLQPDIYDFQIGS